VALEEHDEAVEIRAVGEVVDQQIEAHPRRHAEDGRQPETERRRMPVEQHALHFDLVAPAQRDRPDGVSSVHKLAGLADAVAGVGRRQQDSAARG
jgi:hypothetical protein